MDTGPIVFNSPFKYTAGPMFGLGQDLSEGVRRLNMPTKRCPSCGVVVHMWSLHLSAVHHTDLLPGRVVLHQFLRSVQVFPAH